MYLRILIFIVYFTGWFESCIGSYEHSKHMCLKYAGKCTKRANPLIVGGREADEKEFPHMALIGFGEDEDLQWECGGALISKSMVLTAAHCADSREYGPAKWVKFGLIHREDTGNNVQTLKIKKLITHPDYKRPIKYNDIALIELDGDVKLTDHVWPACLNTDKTLGGEVPSAIGFGKVKFTEEKGHDNLRKVNLPIIETTVCQPFYASMRVSTLNQGGLNERQICAGTLQGGQDTCQGDSGGPLQVYLEEPYCNYNIIGITSFGKFCGYAKSPAIYTNVYHYVPWIAKHVWGV